MDLAEAELLRDLLAQSPFVEETREFARTLRRQAHRPGGLLLFGPPTAEPWHLTAHMADEARYADIPELTPTLLRWRPPPGAPPHLAVGLDRLAAAGRGESLLVVTDEESVPLLERVDDARRRGTHVFALESGQPELVALAHEALAVDQAAVPVSFDSAQHLVSLAAGEPLPQPRRGVRGRLARWLDALSGPEPS